MAITVFTIAHTLYCYLRLASTMGILGHKPRGIIGKIIAHMLPGKHIKLDANKYTTLQTVLKR